MAQTRANRRKSAKDESTKSTPSGSSRRSAAGKKPAQAQPDVHPPVDQHVREVRDAANQLIEGIDTWQHWFNTLRSEKDADPGLAMRCHENCCAAIEALCAHKVNIAPFNKEPLQVIFRMLPQVPDGSTGGSDIHWNAKLKRWVTVRRTRWQRSKKFRALYYGPDGSFRTSLELRAAALRVRKQVDKFPLSVLGANGRATGAPAPKSPENQPSTGAKKRVRANSLRIFPQGTDGISAKLVEFAKHLLAERVPGLSDNEIARKFTGESQSSHPRASSLLARCRKLRAQGRLNF